MNIEHGDWIAPAEAVTALTQVYGNRVVAKNALADLLLDGLVKARAGRSWYSSAESLSDAWWARDEANAEQDVELSARDWMDSEDWFNDVTRWRWLQARFVLTSREDPREWRFLENVSFATADIREAVNIAIGAVARSKGGPNPDVQRWARFWLAVVRMAHHQQLTRTTVRSKDELYKKLKATEPLIMTRRSVDPWIDEIWASFVSAS